MPIRIIITEGTCADIRQTYPLVEGLRPKLVIADKAYSAKAFRNQLEEDDIQALIPEIQRGNKSQKEYDKQLYKVRHFIENTFLHLNQWRAVATRYAKRRHLFGNRSGKLHCFILQKIMTTRPKLHLADSSPNSFAQYGIEL